MTQEKDITEKRLESYADVFADIINVLLFNGERKMQADDLLDSLPHSLYKGTEKKIHDEERDVAKFQSDFKYVADFFVQMRKNKNYKPINWQIKHVAAFLDLMTELTKDSRFAEAYTRTVEGSGFDMTIPFLDEVENRGIQIGFERGVESGIEKTALNMLKKNISFEEIADITELTVDKIKELAKKMND